MERIKDLSEVAAGDLIYIKGQVSVIKAVENDGADFVLIIDDGEPIRLNSLQVVNVYRLKDRDK